MPLAGWVWQTNLSVAETRNVGDLKQGEKLKAMLRNMKRTRALLLESRKT